MPLLTPNSFGSAMDGRVLREYNPHHEPKGSPRGGGRFARSPGGSASSGAGSGKKVKKVELMGHMGDEYDASAIEEVLGKGAASVAKLEAMAESMLRDVDGVSFTVQVKTMRQKPGPGGQWQKPTVIVKFVGDDGDPTTDDPDTAPTSLLRTFSRACAECSLVVKHQSFEKNRALPAGFGKDMLRSHMLTYEEMGVARIETFANIDVGAYAWAKYGFAAADPADVASTLANLVEQYHGRMVSERDFVTGEMRGKKAVAIDDSAARELKRIARSGTKTAIWEFADATLDGVKVGKTLLTDGDQGWDAFLNVKGNDTLSQKQRERFWSYVGRTKQPRPVGRPPKTREAMVIVIEADGRKTEPGELCEWDGRAYTDRRIWDAMLNGDHAHFYDLRDPSARAAYRAALPQG